MDGIVEMSIAAGRGEDEAADASRVGEEDVRSAGGDTSFDDVGAMSCVRRRRGEISASEAKYGKMLGLLLRG